MIVEKKTIDINEKEILDAVEIKDKGEIKYYSYNYKVKSDGRWKIYVRWDNFQKQPHLDKYDENENLVESEPSRDKSLDEILELIGIFGKNLVSMDLSRM
ncbi:MAG: DUF7718 family protein [Thermoplasmatota archaeon]